MKNKGFTVIEMMIVVAIMGIIAALTLPMCIGNKHKRSQEYSQTEETSQSSTKCYIMVEFTDNTVQTFDGDTWDSSSDVLHIFQRNSRAELVSIPKSRIKLWKGVTQ